MSESNRLRNFPQRGLNSNISPQLENNGAVRCGIIALNEFSFDPSPRSLLRKTHGELPLYTGYRRRQVENSA